MIFNLITKAKQLFFDDSTAKTGANDIQGAIDGVQKNVESVQDDVKEVEKKTIYGEEGAEFLAVNSSGDIYKTTFYPTSSKIYVFVKEVLKSLNSVVETLIKNLSNPVIEEKKSSYLTIDGYGGKDFTVNVAKSGHVCIGANIRSTGSYNVVVVGGDLTNPTTFTGTVRNVGATSATCQPLISCKYIKIGSGVGF